MGQLVPVLSRLASSNTNISKTRAVSTNDLPLYIIIEKSSLPKRSPKRIDLTLPVTNIRRQHPS